MTSTPYQVALMKIRHIYRWEDPIETGVYLGSFLILWAINYLAGAAVRSKILPGTNIIRADTWVTRSSARCGLCFGDTCTLQP